MSESESLLDETEDMPEYPGDAPEVEEEESTDAPAEESPDAEEATEDVAPTEEGDPDDSDYLDQIPEEYREVVKKHGDKRVGEIQSAWQTKLDEAAEARKQAQIVEEFNARFASDPQGVIADLQAQAKQMGAADEIPAPGEMPDPLDREAFAAWYAADVQYRQAEHEKALKTRDEEINAIKGNLGAQAAVREREALKTTYGFDDTEMGEFEAEMQRIRSDKAYALQTIAERVKARKGKAVKKAVAKKRVAQAVQGEEERPGLPNTGVRAKPTPTGNILKDVAAELEAEGIKYPGDD